MVMQVEHFSCWRIHPIFNVSSCVTNTLSFDGSWRTLRLTGTSPSVSICPIPTMMELQGIHRWWQTNCELMQRSPCPQDFPSSLSLSSVFLCSGADVVVTAPFLRPLPQKGSRIWLQMLKICVTLTQGSSSFPLYSDFTWPDGPCNEASPKIRNRAGSPFSAGFFSSLLIKQISKQKPKQTLKQIQNQQKYFSSVLS